MNDLRVYCVAFEEYERLAVESAQRVELRDVETGYDYRWTYPEVQAQLEAEFAESHLAGQVVQIDFTSFEDGEAVVLLRDASGLAEMVSAPNSLVGTLEGVYVSADFDSPDLSPTLFSVEDAMDELVLRSDIRTESLAVPLHIDDKPVQIGVGLKMRPFRLPPDSQLDPDTAYVEIPHTAVDYVLFTDPDGPFLADSQTFAAFHDLVRQHDEDDEDDETSYAARWDVADKMAEELAEANPARHRRVQLAIADGVFRSVLTGSEQYCEITDIPRVKRLAGWFMGYHVEFDEDLDGEEAPEMFAMIMTDEDTSDGESYVAVPVSKVLDGSIEQHGIHEADQSLFGMQLQGFCVPLAEILQNNPHDYDGAMKKAREMIQELNADTVVNLTYNMANQIFVRLSRDSNYELATVLDGDSLLADGAIEFLGMDEGDIRVGEEYALECNLLGFIVNTETAPADGEREVELEDFQLTAVLQPSPLSAFRFSEGNVVLAPVASIVSSGFPLDADLRNGSIHN